MSFRTIVIESRCKLEYSLNYLVCRKGNDELKVLLDEIKTIIVNSTQVSITTSLIAECLDKKIKIIFTDSKHNPVGELVPYYNNFYSYKKIKEQMSFDQESKDILWQYITKEKIINQANNLKFAGKDEAYDKLIGYSNEVEIGDASHREGHAAKVYFNALFGSHFSRDFDCLINRCLNYGYAIILSAINREIKSLGYLTELGVHHIGESNSFNLGCDLMEPLRAYVDYYVINHMVDDDNYKSKYTAILKEYVKYNDKDIILDNAIKLYVEDLFQYLKTGDLSKITFIKYEL